MPVSYVREKLTSKTGTQACNVTGGQPPAGAGRGEAGLTGNLRRDGLVHA